MKVGDLYRAATGSNTNPKLPPTVFSAVESTDSLLSIETIWLRREGEKRMGAGMREETRLTHHPHKPKVPLPLNVGLRILSKGPEHVHKLLLCHVLGQVAHKKASSV